MSTERLYWNCGSDPKTLVCDLFRVDTSFDCANWGSKIVVSSNQGCKNFDIFLSSQLPFLPSTDYVLEDDRVKVLGYAKEGNLKRIVVISKQEMMPAEASFVIKRTISPPQEALTKYMTILHSKLNSKEKKQKLIDLLNEYQNENPCLPQSDFEGLFTENLLFRSVDKKGFVNLRLLIKNEQTLPKSAF